MAEKFQCKSKRVISIGEQQIGNNLFLVIDFALNDTKVNLNAVQYSEAFLTNISDNSNDYAGLPLKVDLKKLISGNTSNLTHNYSSQTGKFYNQMIGSFTSFYTIGEGDSLELCGQVRIPKEFDEACQVIQELYDTNSLFVSYEIYVGKYTTINNGEVKYVDKDPDNYLAAYSIVSQPAVVSAKALALVAEIMEKGGETVLEKKYTQEQFIADFKRISKIKEIAELSYDQVLINLYNQLKTALGDDYWNFSIEDRGVDFLIMESYADGSLIRIDFNVDGDTVVILDVYPVTRSYDPINNNEDDEGGTGSMEKTAEQLRAEIAEANANLKIKEAELASKVKELEDKDKELASKDEVIAAKETEIAEKVKQTETLSASVLEKDNKVKELESVNEKYNTLVAEKTAKENEVKKTELAEKYGKLLPKEILAETEIAEALDKLDETKLSAKVVEIALETASKKEPKVQIASRITDNIKIGNGDDAISPYVTINE